MSLKKQIFKSNVLKKLLTEENSCVSLVQATRLLALPPFFLNDMKSGILYQLNTLLKKYDRSLGGIVIGYQNIKVLMDENTGIIPIGSSETEVNISVEFYIFQPKIGSYLEGVINKKSNTHIGCLVHQYFNATILKPEEVLDEDWICKNFNVDDRIIFKVKDLDFTTLLPYIEGNYDGAQLVKVSAEESGNCDKEEVNEKVHKICQFTQSATNVNENCNKQFISDKKDVEKNEVFTANEATVNNEAEENNSSTDKVKKKKKKDKFLIQQQVNDHININVESSVDRVINSDTNDGRIKEELLTHSKNEEELHLDVTVPQKKKKKKKKDEDNHESHDAKIKKDEICTVLPSNIYNKPLEVEDEDSNVFMKIIKNKKELKKRKNEDEEPLYNKEIVCLPSQEMDDNVFYSTQLEPLSGPKKMRISFCSPIPRGAAFENSRDAENTPGRGLNYQDSPDGPEKELKKKQKKRKKEKKDQSEDGPPVKKSKMSSDSQSNPEENKSTERNSLLQVMMEQLCKEQLSRVREELKMSSTEKESFKEEKKRKEEKAKKEGKPPKDVKGSHNEKSQINGDEKFLEVKTIFEKLWKEQLERVKEELSMSDKDSKKTKGKVKKHEKQKSSERTNDESKKITNAQNNSTNVNQTKSEEQSLIDKIYRQEINRVKEKLSKSDTDTVKEKKKKKSSSNKEETTKEKPQNSLYDRLLSEARIAIDTKKVPTAEPEKKEKDTEPKKSKKKTKQKLDDYNQTPDRLKNGSMYDILPTPEAVNPDKSLFSDSEQSHISPIKNTKTTVNGESRKSAVQNLLDEFYKEEAKRLKSESDKDSIKDSGKKSKKKNKTEQTVKEESLYEKLLKEAKSRMDVREESHDKKEKKKKKKKHKMVQDCVKT